METFYSKSYPTDRIYHFLQVFQKKCKLIKIFLLLFFDHFLITPKVK